MLDIALKNMWQKRTRTILTAVSIAVCIMLFLVLSTATSYMGKSYDTIADGFSSQMYVKSPSIISSASAEFPPISSSLNMDKANEIMAMSGLDQKKSAPLLIVALASSQFQGGPPQVMALGIPEGSEKAFYGDARLASGSDVLTGKDQVVLGSTAAMYYNVKVGDTLPMMGKNLTVAGIMKYDDNLLVNGMVMMPLSTAQDIFNRPSVTTALVAPADGNFNSLSASIKEKFPELDVMTPDDMQKSLNAMLQQTLVFIGMINAVMIIVAGVVTLMVMIMSVSERTKEIGMLRAIGASRGAILTMILEESVAVCIAGSILGILLSFVLMRIIFGGVLASWDVMLEAVLFMTVIGVLAAIYPAYRAAKIQPLEALSYE